MKLFLTIFLILQNSQTQVQNIIPIPAQYLLLPTQPYMDTSISSKSYSISFNMTGFAISKGTTAAVLFKTFTLGVNFSGMKYSENLYTITYGGQNLSWCPNNNIACPSSPAFSYMTSALAVFTINNPNLSMYFTDSSSLNVSFQINLANGTTYSYLGNIPTGPNGMFLSTTATSVPNQFSLGCLNIVYNNTMDKILYPNFSINMIVPTLTKNPLSGGALYMFSTAAPTLTLDSKLIASSALFNNGGFIFTAAVVSPETNFKIGVHTFNFCNIYMPSITPASYTLQFISNSSVIFAKATFSLSSTLGVLASASALVQSSTVRSKLDVISTTIVSTVAYNWGASFSINVNLAAAYPGVVTALSIQIKSLLDNSIQTVAVSVNSASFVVNVPSMNINLLSGVNIQISGLTNPMTVTSYPIGFQLIDNTGVVVTQVVSQNLLVNS